jgi:putative membrane-bound dehydrogenase-like protein
MLPNPALWMFPLNPRGKPCGTGCLPARELVSTNLNSINTVTALRIPLLLLTALLFAGNSFAADALRVFIRAGAKTHGPNQHDHPRFLQEWTKVLADHGLKVDGSLNFPTAAQLENTDVLIIYAPDGMNIVGQQREDMEKFLRRGGGLVVLHDGVVSADQNEWAKKVQGGAWRGDGAKKTKWYEGEVGVYFVDTTHPITRGLSNFDWKDEIYYDMDMSPDVHVLATSFENIFILAPQLWTYEQTWPGGTAPYRAFVSIPGHEFDVFNTPHYRAILLRGIAWAGKRQNVDEFCKPEEITEDVLRYPEGGPSRPDREAKQLSVHPDFDFSLVASEPLVEKVISLDWAPDGKLWVAETPEYPNGRAINRNDAPIYPNRARDGGAKLEDRSARDRISWLEDSKGDGHMDKKHIFYEGLELVTSFVFYKDGVIVEQAPDILWLRDTDGDGKADKVVKLFTGFGTSDTHAVINNMRWGRDGWIYSAIGYSAGDPKSGDGTKSFGHITAGIFRFKPDGSAIEQVASGSCNTWGFDFAPDGEMFYTTATCGEHLLHIAMPEKVLARGNVGGGIRASAVIPDHQKVEPLVHHKRQAYLQIDWVGMFTAAAGSCIYDGGAWPEKWNHMHFLHEPTVSLVHNDVLTPDGATYLAKKEQGQENTEFFRGSDLWFRPIHSRVGPDGALYVVDWYNQAAVHNDTRGTPHGAHNAATRPDRDHHFARIWRIQNKQAKKLTALSLDSHNPAAWIQALSSENGWLRMTAHRLLMEHGGEPEAAILTKLFANPQASAITRMHALYLLEDLGQLDNDSLAAAIDDREPIIRKNAFRIISERDNSELLPEVDVVRTALNDPDPRSRLNAFVALGTCNQSSEIAETVVATWPSIKDRYIQSAAIGSAYRFPMLYEQAAFSSRDPSTVVDFVGYITRMIANKQDPKMISGLVTMIARQPVKSDVLKQRALETLGATLRPTFEIAWDVALQSAFSALLVSPRAGVAGAALPLIARWDKNGTLAGEMKPLVGRLRAQLADSRLPDDDRAQAAANLVGLRAMDPEIIPATASLLGSSESTGLQEKVADALGGTGDKAAGAQLISAFAKVNPEVRETIFGQIVKRADWSSAFVQALSDKQIDLQLLGPANLHRLRTHSDSSVAAKANDVINALRGPQQAQKDTLIAQFKPIVEQPGANVENGHKLFTANCTPCHRFKDEGRDLAPNLTGMGAHGPADLLVHVLDPNRQVEPNFYSASIETKDDLSYDGIIARENNVEVFLRNASGDFTIRKDNIKSRRSTGLSLMPEGFESLGTSGIRDLLGFLCADEQRYRILDLSSAFTVNTSKGVYSAPENTTDAPAFRKQGLVKVDEVPFDIVSPQKAVANAVVLKGGTGYAKTLPQSVTAKVGLAAARLHFLGGIAGWGWPALGDSTKNIPVMKALLNFANGGTEEMVFRNGVEFADWIAPVDVPGSKGLPDLEARGQLRVFSKEVKRHDVIDHITLESFDNGIAPTLIGITAELAGAGADKKSAAAATPAAGNSIRMLIVGVGSSHDFKRWFLDEDAKTLTGAGGITVATSDKPDDAAHQLENLDVLFLSNNAPFTNEDSRRRIFDFAGSGKGFLLVHPALWYNWANWPEYNRVLCGGGSRGHDSYAEFEVTVTDPDHPLMRGVPAHFKVKDELYWFEPDPQGTPIKVLATAHSPSKNKDFPMVFVVQHPKARIAAIALGHDGVTHSDPAYRRLLENSVRWTAGAAPTEGAGR